MTVVLKEKLVEFFFIGELVKGLFSRKSLMKELSSDNSSVGELSFIKKLLEKFLLLLEILWRDHPFRGIALHYQTAQRESSIS